METNQISDESFSHLLHHVEGLVYPSPSMLCFQNKNQKYKPHHDASVGEHSVSASSSSNTSGSSTNITKSKRNRAVESKKACKKPKTENPTSAKPVKVRKEKLGERIAALQQLVSPFGKTDTASVLHEAMGYIRFLHDQVQVLSSPYLQRPPSSAHFVDGREVRSEGGYDLRSRGLCLVPLEYTVHMASSNGADYWSAATMGNTTLKH